MGCGGGVQGQNLGRESFEREIFTEEDGSKAKRQGEHRSSD